MLRARRVQEEGLPRKGGCADDAVPAGTAQEELATVQLPRAAEHMCSRLPRGGRGSCRRASVAPSRRKAGGVGGAAIVALAERGLGSFWKRYERGGCIILYSVLCNFFSLRRSPALGCLDELRGVTRPNSWMRFVLVSDHGGCLA